MPYTLCVYYSRTGATEKLMKEIASELKCELVKLDDGVDRSGLGGWLRSGMQAMVWAGRCSAPVRSFLTQYGEELRRTAYVITRSSDIRYEEVFDQMDMYVRTPRVSAVSIRPNTVGSTFWRDEFLTSVRDGGKERPDNAG